RSGAEYMPWRQSNHLRGDDRVLVSPLSWRGRPDRIRKPGHVRASRSVERPGEHARWQQYRRLLHRPLLSALALPSRARPPFEPSGHGHQIRQRAARQVIAKKPTPREFFDQMTRRYPDRVNPGTVWLNAQRMP